MTPEQFDFITDQRFGRLNSATIAACRAVIIDGLTAYSAEDAFKCGRGTVSRYVNKIHAELTHCQEVVAKAKQPPAGAPSCYGRRIGCEACFNNCPVKEQCYEA